VTAISFTFNLVKISTRVFQPRPVHRILTPHARSVDARFGPYWCGPPKLARDGEGFRSRRVDREGTWCSCESRGPRLGTAGGPLPLSQTFDLRPTRSSGEVVSRSLRVRHDAGLGLRPTLTRRTQFATTQRWAHGIVRRRSHDTETRPAIKSLTDPSFPNLANIFSQNQTVPESDQALRTFGGTTARVALRLCEGGFSGGKQRTARVLTSHGVRRYSRPVSRFAETVRNGRGRAGYVSHRTVYGQIVSYACQFTDNRPSVTVNRATPQPW
jgi:hypothetical protein